MHRTRWAPGSAKRKTQSFLLKSYRVYLTRQPAFPASRATFHHVPYDMANIANYLLPGVEGMLENCEVHMT